MRKHAELLCRVSALRKAAATGASAEIGGIDFSYRAVRELARIFALKKREVEKECKDFREQLLGSESFDLKMYSYNGCSWVPGLFSAWLRQEGARLMGAAETWQDLVRTHPTAPLDYPLHFSLDGEQWNHDIPAHLDSNKVRERENKVALIGAWWRLSWQAVCNEVSQRYGEAAYILQK